MKLWFTPNELAKFSLAGLPSSKRAINRVASREDWNNRANVKGEALARKRSGRGGGYEYHYSVLPPSTVASMAKRGLIEIKGAKKKLPTKSEWFVFEKLNNQKKAVANFRLKVLNEVLALEKTGVRKTAAIVTVCGYHQETYRKTLDARHNFKRATVYNWLKAIKGRKKADWLPALAPKQLGRVAEIEIPHHIISYMRGDYLRPEKPSFMACYNRLVEEVAPEQGWVVPHHRKLQRNFLKGVPLPVQVLKRDGMDKLEAMFPPQQRDRSEFHAMEAVNADGHIWDVFVTEDGGKTKFRPVMCAIQDLYSNKFVGWRIGKTLGADIVRLSFGDMFRDYGIPDLCWLDNGREFASKMVTGGAPNRFRFKIKEEEPTGFLTALGVDVRWCRPYRGQSKPIERAFRDFCDHIAKHPKFAGAYAGNKVTNKPSNYGEKAVDFEVFKKVVAQGIKAHNARKLRKTRVCQGKASFDQVFDESYANSAITKASEEQLRLCLLAGEYKKAEKRSGEINILKNRYWSDELATMAGERVIVRFDPDNLHNEIFVYRQDGSYVGSAPCIAAEGFADQAASRRHSNAKKKFMKAQKELAAQQIEMSVSEVAALIPEMEPEEGFETPTTKVVRPMFKTKGNAAVKVDFDFETFGENVMKLTPKTDLDI